MKKNRTNLVRTIVVLAALILFGGIFSISQAATEQQVLVDESEITLRNFVSDPNMESLVSNVQNAKAVVIVPSMIKGGFFLGGSGGRGV